MTSDSNPLKDATPTPSRLVPFTRAIIAVRSSSAGDFERASRKALCALRFAARAGGRWDWAPGTHTRVLLRARP